MTLELAAARDKGRQYVNDKSPTPLYHQVYLFLRNGILNSDYPDGSLLPGEQETSDIFGVSRITAKRALNELAAEGLCVREKGRGTRVTFKPATKPLKMDIQGLLENFQEMGSRTKVSLLHLEYIDAPSDIARKLQLDTGDEVQKVIRLRHLDSKAFSYLTTFVPGEIGRTYQSGELVETPLLELIERSGIRVTSAEQTITATLADGEIAQVLNVEFGSAILKIDRIIFDQTQRPVEYISALYRPDLYQYHMTLSRTGTEPSRIWSQDKA